MKFRLLLFVFFLSSVHHLYGADDVTITQDQLVTLLRQFDLGPDRLEYCSELVDATRIMNCGRSRGKVMGEIAGAAAALGRLDAGLRSYERRINQLSTPRRHALRNIRRVVQCMSEKLGSDMEIVCDRSCPDPRTEAYVRRGEKLFGNKIHLCPLHFTRPVRQRVGSVLHEMSHLCGAKDYTYLQYADGSWAEIPENDGETRHYYVFGYRAFSLTRLNNQTWNNADNYAYWGTEGFELP